jgi:hypothetical protein
MIAQDTLADIRKHAKELADSAPAFTTEQLQLLTLTFRRHADVRPQVVGQ